MTDIITPLFEDSALFPEDIFMNTWSETNVEELNRSLEKAMSPAHRDTDRFGMGSPDSGIHVNTLEYDFNEALLGVDDPIFSDICNLPSGTAVEVVPAEHPVIMSDFTAVNESYDESMEDEDDDEEEETISNYSDEENEENASSNIPKNHPVEIHSYSVIKLKKEHNFKAKAASKPAPASRAKQSSGGRKYKVSVSQKKRKLYEMEPLVDPVAEKNRLNALNAKKNRDRKKQQLTEAEEEISRLREENEELKSEADEVRDELEAARRELAELRAQMKAQPGSRQPALGKARAHN
jgi:hypothetical protein